MKIPKPRRSKEDIKLEKELLEGFVNAQSEHGSIVNDNSEAKLIDHNLIDVLSMVEKDAKLSPQKYIIDGIVHGGCLVIIASPPKVGKSTIAEYLAFCIALGIKTFLGLKLYLQAKVLFISLEEYHRSRAERNRKQIEWLEKLGLEVPLLRKNYFVVNENFARFLHGKEGLKTLERSILASGVSVLIIDSLSRLYKGELESSATALELTRALKNLADKYGITIIIIHHTVKLHGEAITMDKVAGSRALAQEVDAMFGLVKNSTGHVLFKPLALRYADDQWDDYPVFKFNENRIPEFIKRMTEEEFFAIADKRFGSENKQMILDYMLQKKQASTAALCTAFVESDKMVRATLFDNLKKLVAEGALNNSKRGSYSVPSIVEDEMIDAPITNKIGENDSFEIL